MDNTLPENQITVEEMNYFIDSIYKFINELGNPKQNIIWLSNIIIRRLKSDFDMYSIIEGNRGRGKSSLLIMLSLLICRYAGLYKNKKTGKIVKVLPRTTPMSDDWERLTVSFDFKKHISFLDNVEDVKKKFNSISKYEPFGLDEGSKNLHRQNWASKMQFMLVKLSDTQRYQNKAFFICFPNFRELNSVFRNDRVMLRLYVYERGQCIISLKDPNRYALDPWHLDSNFDTTEYYLKRYPIISRGPKQILYAESKTKNYAGNFAFPDLKKIAPRIWEVYYKYKVENAQKDINDDETTKDSKSVLKWKAAVKSVVRFLKETMPELSISKISSILKISKITYSELMNNKLPNEDKESLEDAQVYTAEGENLIESIEAEKQKEINKNRDKTL